MIKQLLAFLTVCAVLAVAQYVTAAAWAAVAVVTVMAAVVHPRAVLNLIAGLGLLAMALRAPAAMSAALAAVGMTSVVAGHVIGRRRPQRAVRARHAGRPLLAPNRDHSS